MEFNNVVGKNICWVIFVLRDGFEFYDKYFFDKILWKFKLDVYFIVGLCVMILLIFGVDV